MTKKSRNWLLALCIVAFPFVLFFGFLVFMQEPLPPVTPLPNPNGYEDFVKAGEMVVNGSGDSQELNHLDKQQLSGLMATNADALQLLRAGLSNQCRVPIQFSENYMGNHLNDLASLKRLAWVLAAEGRLAEEENRPGDAAKSYLDAIHLGNDSVRGGVLIDELVGIAIEAIGTSHLQTLLPQLDASSCRETAAALEDLDSQRQTWNEVMQQESAWSHGTFRGWRYNLMLLEAGKSVKAAIAATRRKLDAQEQRTRQLMIDLAARAYELDKGHPPARVADLVPEYLKVVPQDPVTGTNLIYSPR